MNRRPAALIQYTASGVEEAAGYSACVASYTPQTGLVKSRTVRPKEFDLRTPAPGTGIRDQAWHIEEATPPPAGAGRAILVATSTPSVTQV